MLIESFLCKIITSIFGKIVLSTLPEILSTAYHIYTVIDTISDIVDGVSSTNDCFDLGVTALEVVSDSLSEAAVNRLMEIGSDTFTVEKTSSGIYVASRFVPTFRTNSFDFPTNYNRGGRGNITRGGRGSFRSGGR